MKKKEIVWITADYFIDVDKAVVPYLQLNSEYNIKWCVVRSQGQKIEIPSNLKYDFVYSLRYRGKDPRVIFDYINILKDLALCNADLIYSDYLGVPYYFPLLQLLSHGIPIVHAAHNVIPYSVWPFSTELYIKYIFKTNKYFHFFSRFTSDYYKRKFGGDTYFYCPMAVKGFGDVATDNYLINKTKLNLLFFGNVMSNKRLDLLVKAVRHLPAVYSSRVHLTICGNCKETKYYEDLIANATNIESHFHRIPDKEVAELFTKHDYLILPYEDVAQSGPHMIAYYYNLPVIASNINGFIERVVDGKNGFLFHVNDEQSLIDVICKAASLSPAEYSGIKENLKSYTDEHFSLRSVSEKYISYFNLLA